MNLRPKKIILRLLSYLTRWVWRLVVFVLIAIAIIVSAGRELAPLLHEHKIWLEANLTASTGEIVTMQQVDAYWEGLVPELAVRNLTIGNTLQVDNALMRIDLLGSARSFALVFDTLDVSRASVTIPVGVSATDTAFDFRAYLEFLFGSADIQVRNLEISLQQGYENQLSLRVDKLVVKNDASSHWLNASIAVGNKLDIDKNPPNQLTVKFHGDPGEIFAGSGRAHIEIGDKNNLPLLWQFLAGLPGNESIARSATVDYVSGQAWVSWKNERIKWVFETSIKGLAPETPKISIDFDGRLAGNILLENAQAKEYFIQTAPDQEIFINHRRYPLPVVGLQYTTEIGDNEYPYKVYLPDFNLATVTEYLELLPSKEWRSVLKKLNPSGNLKNLLVSLPAQETVDPPSRKPLVQARLDKVSVSAWQGAPALAWVDGYLEASADSGFVELDSQQGFSMHYKTLYRQAMQYNTARGRIDWQMDHQHIYVGSRDLDFHGDDGDLRGTFWLDIPPAHSPQAAELYLTAGLTNAHVKYRNKYLPYTLTPSLRDWLATAIKDGGMRKSGFIYRGLLAAGPEHEQTLLFYSDVDNGRLRFDPAWPELEHINAFVLVDNERVHANIKSGNFLGTKIHNAIVDVKPSSNKQAHYLTLQVDTIGSGSDVLNVMRDTPLRKTFGTTFDGWQLQGMTKGRLDLGLHIGDAAEHEYQEIDLHLKGNNLLVGKIDLPLDQLSGDIHYSSTAGLSSTQLTARLWDQPQVMTITPVADNDSLPDMLVTMTGNIDSQAAAVWSHLPFVHFFKGNIPVTGSLSVPLDITHVDKPDGTLSIQSQMKGIAIDLPEPFRKIADDSLPARLDVELWKNRQLYRVEYGQLMTASVEQDMEGKLKGDIVINQPDSPPVALPDYLRIRANIDQASLSEWLPVMDRHTAFSKADERIYKKNASSETAYPVFDLFIKQLSIGSLKLDDIKLLTDYKKDQANGNYWNVAFQNDMMTGRYHYFDDTERLPEIDFDVVKLGEADPASKDSSATIEEDDSKRVDPLADVVPQDLPAMRVHATQVWLQGDNVGDWRYTLNPDKEGVVLNDLFVTMPGLVIKGNEKDQGATVRWTRSGNDIRTEVNSNVSLSNQDGLKNLFGIERIIEAEKTNIQGIVHWNGSPAMLSFRRMQGDLSLTSQKGRFLNSTASTDLMRVINVFNFTTWARRLKLDFTDLYQKGVSYDKVSARLKLDQGKVTFDKPLVMEGPSGRFELKGTIDSVQNLIDASLIVTIPVNKNATWIAALAAGLPVAVGVWAVGKIFSDQIDKLSSVNYSISGTLDEPKVKFVSLLPELSKENKAEN